MSRNRHIPISLSSPVSRSSSASSSSYWSDSSSPGTPPTPPQTNPIGRRRAAINRSDQRAFLLRAQENAQRAVEAANIARTAAAESIAAVSLLTPQNQLINSSPPSPPRLVRQTNSHEVNFYDNEISPPTLMIRGRQTRGLGLEDSDEESEFNGGKKGTTKKRKTIKKRNNKKRKTIKKRNNKKRKTNKRRN